MTEMDIDYELIDRNGKRDTVAGNCTYYGVHMPYYDKHPELSIAKEKLRSMGYTVANF